MIDDYIRIAVVTGVHGLTGRMKILVISDIRERFEINKPVYIDSNGTFREFIIADYTQQKGKTGLLQLEGIHDRNAALLYKGCDICIDKAEAEKTRSELDEESHYYYDIIGCSVFHEGRPFGTVTDILAAGAGEILVITDGQGKIFMIPFVEPMVDTRDIQNRRLDIHPVEGLLDI